MSPIFTQALLDSAIINLINNMTLAPVIMMLLGYAWHAAMFCMIHGQAVHHIHSVIHLPIKQINTRKLCYCKGDRAMCLMYECPESF